MGARAETFYGLSGIGDLIVTCASKHSRNRRAGILLGQGKTMEEAMKEVKMVVEGVYSAKGRLGTFSELQVDTPIIQQVNQVLFEEKETGTWLYRISCSEIRRLNPGKYPGSK